MEYLVTFLGVLALDVILSGDNALVIAAVANQLPAGDRKAAINYGMAAACVLRIVFLLLAVTILQFHWIAKLAGICLLVIAWKLGVDIIKRSKEANTPESERAASSNMWIAVTAIITADVSMSFDNVISVAGLAHNYPVMMVLGVAISIGLLTLASKWIQGLLDKWPWLNWVGVALIVTAAFNLLRG